MRKIVLSGLIICLGCLYNNAAAQFSLVVNELSQGTGGSKEFIELVVVGTRTCTDSTADIRNWIFDDHNGWYAGANSGIATGHYRFSNSSNWQHVPYGSVILIYNNADRNLKIATANDDATDANHDYVYQLPIAGTLIEQNITSPLTPSSPSYSYPATGYAASTDWVSIGLANGGDGVIVVNPANPATAHFSIIFGIGAGGGTFQTPTVQKASVDATHNLYLSDAQYATAASWIIGDAGTADETPGQTNTAANAAWINGLRIQATPPVTPVAATTPTGCTTNTGSITVTSPTGTGYTYSINGINFQASPVFTALAAGNYTVTVKNASGCSSGIAVTIAGASAPAVPTYSVTPLSCTASTATITVLSPTGTGLTYSINGINFQTGTSFSGLLAGDYTITVKNLAGCTSSVQVTVGVAPTSPSTPTFTLTQPGCSPQTGSLTVTSPSGIEFTYSVDGSNFQAGTTFTGLVPGTYTITVHHAAGCNSTSPFTINAAPPVPATPVLNIVQPGCQVATATITVTSPVGTGFTYSLDGISYQASNVFNALSPGSYIIRVKNTNGCSSSSATATVNAAPASPATPVAVITQPSCTVATGSVTISSPSGTGLTYSLDGINFQASNVFSNVAPGSYSIVAKNASGCTSGINIVVNPAPAPPSAPAVNPVAYCLNATAAALTATGNGLLWYTVAAGGTGSSTAPIPSTATAGTTTYYVAQTAGGCESPRAALIVTVTDVIVAAITGSNKICLSGAGSTQLLNATPGGVWSTSDNSIATVSGSGLVTATGTGNAVIQYTVTNGACSKMVNFPVSVFDLNLQLSASANPVEQGAPVTLSTTANGSYQVLGWLPSAVFIDQAAFQQAIIIPASGIYSAIAQNADGCRDTANINIVITPATKVDIFVPNVFTPNNDGNNDLFKVYSTTLKSMEFMVYNQWGQLIYRTANINAGWDGTYKGKAQPATVYSYVLKAVMVNNSIINKKGSVTLLR